MMADSNRLNHPDASVQLIAHPTQSGHLVAEARLNSPATLNALSLGMIDLLAAALRQWAEDDQVVAVLLSGSGDRAFSAGGDIQALYRAIVVNHERGERIEEYPYDFFEREYRLDYQLHTYSKPIIALGHGVMMGGGLGVFMAADFRTVPEKTRIAMPEVTIGLFPDAGGSWMLRNMARHEALFLGVTGASVNSHDAMLAGLATHAIPFESYGTLRQALLQIPWQAQPADDSALISELLAAQPVAELPEANLPAVPEALAAAEEFSEVISAVRALRGCGDWLDAGVTAMERGCPTTVGIVVEQLARAAQMTLAECFRMEMTIATHCADNHDFVEGVRALLIEKDNQPDWQFGDLDSLPRAYVLSHFEEPWARNPLAELEQERL
jgi:enoyl-CoA hydratase/carnithine racemase